jgi:hypothetical protein
VRTTYSDGGQNAIFAALMKKGVSLGDVSRPEALAFAGLDVTLVPARRHRRPTTPAVATAEPGHAMPLVATLVSAHVAPLPEHIEPVALMPQLLRYSLYKPPVTQALIDGAMPMRAAVLTN